jgi:prolyl oligopeptidase
MAEDQYPAARRLDLTEDLLGHRVADPYRWLEDPGSAETRAWLGAEDELFRSYAAALPGVTVLAERILELTGTGHVGVPVWRGARRFFSRRLPGEEHAALCTVDPGPGDPAHPGPGDPSDPGPGTPAIPAPGGRSSTR